MKGKGTREENPFHQIIVISQRKRKGTDDYMKVPFWTYQGSGDEKRINGIAGK